MVSPASWSDHMLLIKAEDRVAGQQLNVSISAWCVFSNGINCDSNKASQKEPLHTFSILSHMNACMQLLPYHPCWSRRRTMLKIDGTIQIHPK
jgi:hypothetical protein